MADYAGLRTRVYGLVEKYGASVTFTGVTTTVDKVTGESTVTTATVPGKAITTPGALKLYEALKLVAETSLTFLVAPAAGSDLPVLGMTVAWGGVTYTVKYTQAIAPGGTLLLGRVIVST